MSHPAAHHADAHAEHFDAHGHKDHGHVIVSIWTLRSILAILLFFTFATVAAAWIEMWISSTFNVLIPQWINVTVALSIAVVKTTLVVMFFMQLKYDNPLNTMIFIFTVMTVAFFLGFTAIDMGGRQSIDRFKAYNIYEGGKLSSGGQVVPPPDPVLAAKAEADAQAKSKTPFVYANTKTEESIVDRARRLAAERKALGLNGHGKAGHHDDHHGHGELGSITEAGYRRKTPKMGSSEERSRPVRGVTLPGFADTSPVHDDHGSHDGHAAPAPAPAAPAAQH